MDQLPRLGKRELICLLLFTCNCVVSVWRGFLFLWVLGMGYVILFWHSMGLPYNYFYIIPMVLRATICRASDHRFQRSSSPKAHDPIKTKFHEEPSWEGGTEVYINVPCHMNKMAATSIYVYHFQVSSSPELKVL